MTQIENLIVVEVPKGAKWKVSDEYIYRWHGDHIGWMADPYNQLPFPCSIIGLASEVGLGEIKQIFIAARYKYLFGDFIKEHSLTSPDKDYLFLKRKG